MAAKLELAVTKISMNVSRCQLSESLVSLEIKFLLRIFSYPHTIHSVDVRDLYSVTLKYFLLQISRSMDAARGAQGGDFFFEFYCLLYMFDHVF